MKILFLIYSGGGKASGGHFNSLHQVSQEMAKTNDVEVLMLGKKLSPIIADNPFFKEHIIIGSNLLDIKKLNNSLKNLYKFSRPDVIHCFDTESLNLILVTPFTKKIPIVFNKCGGPNPLRNNHQHADATVVFSQENQQWYYNNKHYKKESIFLIPNRVMSLKLLSKNHRIEKANPEKITFVRVSRLGGAYEMTLRQTFMLLEKLHNFFQVELYVIGRIQDQNRFDMLKSEGEQMSYSIHYITDERASKGSSFLYLADFVIGTGRSFMEATSLGIPSLTPACKSEIPILVDSSNVNHFLATNFSERNLAREGDEDKTIKKIKELVSNKQAYKSFQEETKVFFEELFGTSKINEKYSKVYSYVVNKGTNRIQLIKDNFLYLLKNIIFKK